MKNGITKMKVWELLKKEIDIDVYDNVCEELGIAFCGPQELTDEGHEHFYDALYYDVEIIAGPYETLAIVDVDAEEGEWQKKLALAKELFYGMAGWCSEETYKRWFKEV